MYGHGLRETERSSAKYNVEQLRMKKNNRVTTIIVGE